MEENQIELEVNDAEGEYSEDVSSENCEVQEELSGSEEAVAEPEAERDAEREAEERVQQLKTQIEALEGVLENKIAEIDRKAGEYAEFKELYPGVNLFELAPEVSESVASGVPLAAAYALYEKRQAHRASAVKAHNKATREGGFSGVGKSTENEYYTPDEVRAMDAREVRANYQKILRSMKSWH
jgi:hypothetical protein